MGSLYSKPKIPATVTYTAPAAPPATAPAAAAPAAPAPATAADQPAAESERAAVLVRRRSLPETVLTSFRGVLSQGAWVPARKSLLGE